MPPQQGYEQNPIIWEVHPSLVPDDEQSKLFINIHVQAPYADVLKKLLHGVASTDEDYYSITYSIARRVVGCATRWSFQDHNPLIDFLIEPRFMAEVFKELFDRGLLADTLVSVDQLCSELLAWRNNLWGKLPEACVGVDDDLLYGEMELIDYYDLDAAGNPWLAEAVMGDWKSEDLNPLFIIFDDMSPVCCQAQLALSSFEAQVDRVARAMAKFTDHPDTAGTPFTADLARATLTEFGEATQWGVDEYLLDTPATPQLQRYRLELAGVGNTPSTAEYFYRAYGRRLAYRHTNLSLLAQRAASSQNFFGETLRLAQGYAPGRYRAAEPAALFAGVELSLHPRNGRLLQLLKDEDATASAIVTQLLVASHADSTRPADGEATHLPRGAASGYDEALTASVGTTVASERACTMAANRAEYANAEATAAPLLGKVPLPTNEILFIVATSRSLYLLQALFNVGKRAPQHELCRQVHSLRSYLPSYAMHAFMAPMDLKAKPPGAQSRLRALCWPAAQLKALMTLRLASLDFLNDGYYLMIATEANATQSRVDFLEAMLDPVEMRRMGRYGSAVFQAFGWDETKHPASGEYTYVGLCELLATKLEDLGPRIRHDHALWTSVKAQVKDCYLHTMEFAGMEAQRVLLSPPDSAAFGVFVTDAASGPIAVLLNHLETLSTGSDMLAVFYPAAKRACVGPSRGTPSGGGSSSRPSSGVGSKSSCITYNSKRTVIYRGKQGYSVAMLQQRLPGVCPAIALSVEGDPLELCDRAGEAGHGALGEGAHALSEDYRSVAYACWCHKWQPAKAGPSKRPTPEGGPVASPDLAAAAAAPAEDGGAQESGERDGGRGRGRGHSRNAPRRSGSGGGKGGKGKGKGGPPRGKGKGKGGGRLLFR